MESGLHILIRDLILVHFCILIFHIFNSLFVNIKKLKKLYGDVPKFVTVLTFFFSREKKKVKKIEK
jgi:hypothetical protein